MVWVLVGGSMLLSGTALWAISREDHPWSPRRRRWPPRVAGWSLAASALLVVGAVLRGPMR
jgi:hypothetical protein